MTEPLLRVTGLYKHFGGIVASDNVNLEVTAGHIHAVIGPNGAGKTTLISQLCGQLQPDRGSIIFAGEDITNHSIAQRAHAGLGRSFQITSVVMAMTLLENVMLAVQARRGHSFRFWAPVSKDKKMRDSALAYLDEMGLADRAQQVTASVSHGEQRQLEVAMVLAMNPRLLLLDEPMAGMGKEESGRMIEKLKLLRETKTILLVEHDMDAVFSLADELSVLVSGHVIATDSVENIRKNKEVQRAYLGEGHA